MILLFKRKNYWGLLPFFLTNIILIILFCKNLRFNFFHDKADNFFDKSFLTYFVIVIPALFIFFSNYWRQQALHRKFLLFSLTLFIFTFSFRLQQAFQASALFAVAAIYYFIVEKKIYRPNLFFVLIFIYFLFDAISLFWSVDKKFGFEYLRNLSPLAFIPILFCLFEIKKADFTLIALLIFRFSLFFVFVTICTWILQIRFLDFPILESFTHFKFTISTYQSYDVVYAWSNHTHPTYNAINIVFALSIGWYFMPKKNVENDITSFEFIFSIVAGLIIIIITSSRFMLVMWAFINLAGFLYVIRKKKKMLYVSIILFIILGIIFAHNYFDKICDFIIDPVRINNYKIGIQSIKERPWLGTGVGGMYKTFHLLFPDNEFIGDWAQTGILGLIIILMVQATLFFYSFKQKNWLLFINILVFLTLMNIEMPLMYINGIFSFILIFSFLTKAGESTPVILYNLDNTKSYKK